jgi:uncharacterized protein YkwD
MVLSALALVVALTAISPSPSAAELASQETRMLADVNATRAGAGLRPLQLSNRLHEAAVLHAADMADKQYFDHKSRDGSTPFDRMRAVGCRFGWAGENLALGDSEPHAYAALLDSAPHRENILNPHFSRVGIGVVRADDGTLLFVQDFSD